MSDPGLARALQEIQSSGHEDGTSGGGSAIRRRLVLYLTYQPCHHSGGHNSNRMGEHGTSCTRLLCDYVRDVLAPAGVTLEIKIAYLYRAHWQVGSYDPKYAPAVRAAREGLEMLAGHGITLDAFWRADWEWLLRLCDEQVRKTLSAPVAPRDEAPWALRLKMDGFIASFLRDAIQRPMVKAPMSVGGESRDQESEKQRALARAGSDTVTSTPAAALPCADPERVHGSVDEMPVADPTPMSERICAECQPGGDALLDAAPEAVPATSVANAIS